MRVSKNKFHLLFFFLGILTISHIVILLSEPFNNLLFGSAPVRMVEQIMVASQSNPQSTIFLPFISTPVVWKPVGQNSNPNGRITNFTHPQGAFQPAIAVAKDGVVYIAYSARNYESPDNLAYIYVMRWSGANWELLDVNPINNEYDAYTPYLAVNPDGQLYIAFALNSLYWTFPPNSHPCPPSRIFIKHWTSAGWELIDETNPGCGSGVSDHYNAASPRIAFSLDGELYVTWAGYPDYDGPDELFVKQWNGQEWLTIGRTAWDKSLDGGTNYPRSPVIGIGFDATVYVAWNNVLGLSVSQYQNGLWSDINSGLPNEGSPSEVSIAIAPNGIPYIAWQQKYAGVWQIYVKMWNGSSWIEVGNNSAANNGISNTIRDSIRPSIFVSDSGIYVAWLELQENSTDINNSLGDVYVRHWNGSIWEEVGHGSATGGGINNSNKAHVPQVAMDNSEEIIYVVWPDKDEMEVGQVHIKYASE